MTRGQDLRVTLADGEDEVVRVGEGAHECGGFEGGIEGEEDAGCLVDAGDDGAIGVVEEGY